MDHSNTDKTARLRLQARMARIAEFGMPLGFAIMVVGTGLAHEGVIPDSLSWIGPIFGMTFIYGSSGLRRLITSRIVESTFTLLRPEEIPSRQRRQWDDLGRRIDIIDQCQHIGDFRYQSSISCLDRCLLNQDQTIVVVLAEGDVVQLYSVTAAGRLLMTANMVQGPRYPHPLPAFAMYSPELSLDELFERHRMLQGRYEEHEPIATISHDQVRDFIEYTSVLGQWSMHLEGFKQRPTAIPAAEDLIVIPEFGCPQFAPQKTKATTQELLGVVD